MFSIFSNHRYSSLFQFVSLGIGCLDAMPTGPNSAAVGPLSFVCFYSENAEFWDMELEVLSSQSATLEAEPPLSGFKCFLG